MEEIRRMLAMAFKKLSTMKNIGRLGSIPKVVE